ncbi:MAG: hypothetical protein JWN44_6633 [Myxococcales bacterium]|nr:hypothetical protein [Myxococcales bacterium]
MKFTAARTSVFGSFCVGLAVVTGFEMPVVHLLAHGASWLVHVVIAAVNVWTWVWLYRERRAMLAAAHVVDEAGLHIALGRRWRGLIEWSKIAAVARVTDGRSTKGKGTIRVTPLEAPNVEIVATEVVTLRGSYGIERRGDRVLLYVDDPDGLVQSLRRR